MMKINPIIEILQKEVSKKLTQRSKTTKRVSIKDEIDTIVEKDDDSDQSEDESSESEVDELDLVFSDALKKESKDYEPFMNFKKDLRLLITFKTMISKIVQELCNILSLN